MRTLLDDRALLVKCRLSKLFKYTPPPPGAAEAAEAAAKAAEQAVVAGTGQIGAQPTRNGEAKELEADREGGEDDDVCSSSGSEDIEEEGRGEDVAMEWQLAGGEAGEGRLGAAAADHAAEVKDANADGAPAGSNGQADSAARGGGKAAAAAVGGCSRETGRGRGRGRGRDEGAQGRGRSGNRGRRRAQGTADEEDRARRPVGPPSNMLFRQLVDLFAYYMSFPINDHTGELLTDDKVTAAHYEKASWRAEALI